MIQKYIIMKKMMMKKAKMNFWFNLKRRLSKVQFRVVQL